MTYQPGHVPDFADRYTHRQKECQCGHIAADWPGMMAHCADPAADEYHLEPVFREDETSAGQHRRKDGYYGNQARLARTWVCDGCGREQRAVTLRDLRLRLEVQPTFFDPDDWGGCGCMEDRELAA